MQKNKYDFLTFTKKYITTEFLTLGTFFIYGWGLLYNYFYFQSFEINITKYISLQEILFDTLLLVFSIGLASLVFIVVGYYLTLGIFLSDKKKLARKLVLIQRKRNSVYFLRFTLVWGFLEVIFLTFLVISIKLFDMNSLIFIKYAIPIIGISNAYKMYLLEYFLGSKINQILFYSFIIFVILSSIYLIAIKEAKSILQNKSIKKEVIILSTGNIYTTNDSILYIGETNSTLFLFDKPKNNTIIINKSNVIQTQLINQATIKVKNE